MSASVGADFPMIPRESALFSSSCKLISLRVVPCHVNAKASIPQTPWGLLGFWLYKGYQVGRVGSKAIDFPIGGFSPPEGRLARGFKPPAFSRFLFQSAVKSAASFLTHQLSAGGRLV